MRIAALLVFSLALSFPLSAQSPPGKEILIDMQDDGSFEVSLKQKFETRGALETWLRSLSKGEAEFVVRAPKELKHSKLVEVLDFLAKNGAEKVTVAMRKSEVSKTLDDVARRLEEKKLLVFGKWLPSFYSKEHGEDYRAPMWKDLMRALGERRPYLSANLIYHMPRVIDGAGKDSPFIYMPGETIPGRSLLGLLKMVANPKVGGEAKNILIRSIGILNERRGVKFLTDLMNNEKAEFRVRSEATRALGYLRGHKKIRQMTWGILIPLEANEAGLKHFQESQSSLNAWFEEIKHTLPRQWSEKTTHRPPARRR